MSFPSSINEVPFFRLLIPITLGIFLQIFFNLLPASPAIFIIPISAFLLLTISYFLFQQWQYRWLFGIALNLFLFVSGVTLSVNFSYSNAITKDTETKVVVRLLDNPQQRVRSVRAKCQITNVLVNQRYVSSSEDILLYFSISDTLVASLKYGDVIAATITPREFDEPLNPYQFDMRQYMRQEGIRFSAYVAENNWIRCGSRPNALVAYSLGLRDRFVELFKKYNIKGQELAVVSALTLGYRELLDDEIQKVYSSTGAMHILSVSGLHVGILYLVLALVLRLVPDSRILRPLKLLISLLFLWFFALLTGLSPSVSRSALMFSLVAIGQSFGVRSNVMNTLAIAAFVLLVANPYNLLNVGFQLSFIALLSIVVFYPFIYPLFYTKNKVLDYIWSLVAVSIAAQIGTFPITAASFSQFPNYFILTNLIAIPLSTLILYSALLLLVISPFSMLASWVGKLLNFLLVLLNGGLSWVEEMPGSLWSGIHLSILQTFLIVVSLVLLTLCIIKWKFLFFHLALALSIAVLSIGVWHRFAIIRNNEFVVFNIPRESAVCYRSGGIANFIKLDTLMANPVEQYGFYLSGYVNHETYWGQHRCWDTDSLLDDEKVKSVQLRKNMGLALLKMNKMLVALPYCDSAWNLSAHRAIDVDVLLVNNHFSSNLLCFIRPKLAVIDGSVSRKKLDKLMLLLVEHKIPIYDSNVLGAFRLNID